MVEGGPPAAAVATENHAVGNGGTVSNGQQQQQQQQEQQVSLIPLEDPLGPPSSRAAAANHLRQNTGSIGHTKTYTAGEDGSRLAAAARELGLKAQQARQPRQQVRRRTTARTGRRTSLSAVPEQIVQMLLDTTTEDARMLAVYSFHDDQLQLGQQPLAPNWVLHSIEEEDSQRAAAEQQQSLAAEGGGAAVTEEEADGDPHAHEVPAGGDLTSAVLGIIKGMVGPAILYLPHGFAKAGYIVALPIMLACTAMFLYSAQCLLDSWSGEHARAEQQQRQEQDGGNYDSSNERTRLLSDNSDVGVVQQRIRRIRLRRQMLSYPELAYRALGKTGEAIVKAGIALMQSGVCLTYLIFVPQNLRTSALQLFHVDISAQYWLVVMVVVQIPLSWIRDIRRLTPTNLLANCLILYGLITCLGFAVSEAVTPDPGEVSDGPLAELGRHLRALAPFAEGWFLFIGTSVLLFEGSITLLVPLQEAVAGEEQRKQFPAVYRRVVLGIIVFYAFFGIVCWMAFGNSVKTVLTTSLPETALATTVQLAYSVAVVFTFPLQNFPSLEIACRSLQRLMLRGGGGGGGEGSSTLTATAGSAAAAPTTPPDKTSKPLLASRNVISSVLVLVLAVVAVCTMESLDKVVSLMGSLLGCPIAFVFPPLIHTRLQKPGKCRTVANYVVAVLGVGAMAMASVTTLATWK